MINSLPIRLVAILAIILGSISSYAQCNIDNFTVEVSECQDGNTVNVTVDFDTNSPSSIGYQVITNTGFTVVQIDQFPYTLTLDGNCVTNYNVGIKDLSESDCEVTENIGVICCNIMCAVDAEIIELECTADQTILASIGVSLTGSLADSVDIYTNDEYISTQAIAETSMIDLPSLGPVQNLVVCEQGSMCCDTLDINDPCFCNIFDIHLAVTDCDPVMEAYYLRVDFETSSPSSDSFSLGRPGNPLGTHAYADLPVRVGPIEFIEDDNDIFILDQTDAFCFGFIPHMTLDSCNAVSCELSDLEASVDLDCENTGDATFTFSFDTSLESQGFEVNIDGENYGPYAYGQSEYSIGPVASDGISSSILQITDLADSECSISTEVTPVLCDCDIDNVAVTQFCNEDVLISVLLDFDANGSVSDSFDLISSVSTSRYAYSELPISISDLPTENIFLEIKDAINNSCSLTITEPLECVLECEITNFEVEVLSCEGLGFANLAFTFDHNDLSTDTVVLSYNGNELGNYIVQDTGVYIIPFLEIDCEIDFNSFGLAPINDPDCGTEFPLPNIDCCTPCVIDSTEITVTCLDNFSLSLLIDFEYDGNDTDTFDLFLNDELFGSFAYNQIPINTSVNSEIQGTVPYSFVFENCSLSDAIEYDCTEDCIVENIQLDTLDCNNGMFTALLNFDHSENNDSFLLFVNGLVDGTYPLDQLPISIGPYVADGEMEYTITISIQDEESCIGTLDIGAVDCGPNAIGEATINNIKWSTLPNGILINGISSFEQMTLIDLNGRIIEQQAINSDQLLIENSNRMHGLYFVRLQNQEGNIHTIKVIL